jgi:hypothetical protein
MLLELARNLEAATGDGSPSRKPDVALTGSSPKSLELTTSRRALVEKVDGSDSSAVKASEFSEPEWEPDVNLAWGTRQVTEELWRTWNGNDPDIDSDTLDDLPPPPPPPPLPPPPGKFIVGADVLSLSSGLGLCQGEAFTADNTGQLLPAMWPVAPMGFYAPCPELYGVGAPYDQVNRHDSTSSTFGRESRQKQESLIDLAAARQHIEQQLQQHWLQPSDQLWQQRDHPQQSCEKTQPSFCTFCGGKFQPSSKFCIFCGAAASLSAC